VNDQTVSILVGFGVVVGLRLLDWVFPKGYVWVKIRNWSVKAEPEDDSYQKSDKGDTQ
jgi:hypothetical protein